MNRERFKQIAGKGRHTAGWKRGVKDPRDFHLQVSWSARLTQPTKLNLRTTAKLPRVEDQGEVGSCTANATTDAMEFLRLKAGIEAVELSRLDLYFKTRKAAGDLPAEDNGAQLPDVMRVARKLGVCREELWPYDPAKFAVEPPAECAADAEKNQVLYYYRCASVLSVCASIVQGFPVVIGFDCPVAMFTDEVGKSGLIPMPDGQGFDGGHAVEIVGYDKATRLYDIKNSWGEAWGDGGFGRIPFDFQDKGWLDDCYTVRLAEIDPEHARKAP